MHPVLRLFEDTIAGGSPDVSLPALPRMIFVCLLYTSPSPRD